jgi:glycosyltransferase involved in cell wall biosynthesis
MKILYVQHDLLVWSSARQWSYTVHMAFVEGLLAAGHEVVVLFTACWDWARNIAGDQHFDQVWINDVIHSIGRRPDWEAPVRLTADDFRWLASLAPVRVGIVLESLFYGPADYAENPELAGRVPLLRDTVLPWVTHFCVVDEHDVRNIENLGAQGIWMPAHVPARFFRPSDPDTTQPAVFIGSAYARRQKYAQHPRLRGLLAFKASGEHGTNLPDMFEQLNNGLRRTLLSQPYSKADYARYTEAVFGVRDSLFHCFLDGLTGALATVNLPSFFKGYASRVVESMAIGQPVVSWRIPDRPATARLFQENETILFFDNDDPADLARSLERLRDEPALASGIGARSLANAQRYHTSERRMQQILDWIASGQAPVYWNRPQALAA